MKASTLSVLATLGTLGTLALTACDSWLTKPSQYSTVHVVATRRNGDPVPGVGLTLYTGPRPMGYGSTDSAGQYTFTRVPRGQYGVAASIPPGYDVLEHLISAPVSTNKGLDVAPGDTLTPVRFTFLKIGSGTITVRVAQAGGVPMSGIRVQLFDPKKVDSVATTDSSGQAVFRAVPYGDYGVVAFRPFYFRDYVTPNDSLYTFFNGDLIIEAGSSDTAAFTFARCAGSVRALVVDDAGVPVPNVFVVLYIPTPQGVNDLKGGYTGADGRFTFNSLAPCAVPFAVRLGPPPGYTATGRGSFYLDGLTVSNGATSDITFHVHKVP